MNRIESEIWWFDVIPNFIFEVWKSSWFILSRYKDGEELPDSEHVKLTALPDGSIRLYIDKVVPLDCGAYKIVAKNKNGEASTICAVAVKRKYIFVSSI